MTWASHVAMWRMHAASREYQRTLRTAVNHATIALTAGRLVGCISGGKDSAALGHVLRTVELTNNVEIPCVYAHCDLNAPGQRESAEALADKLQLDLDIIEPTVDVWEFMKSIPSGQHILRPPAHVEMLKRFSAGDMLISYQYEHEFDGAISGMRGTDPRDGGESRGRMMNARTRGPLYKLASDGMWMSNPLASWTARDVWACIVSNDLPVHDHYQRLYERFKISPESPSSRVDSILVSDSIAAHGALEHTRALYPRLYHKLVEIRPEVGTR